MATRASRRGPIEGPNDEEADVLGYFFNSPYGFREGRSAGPGRPVLERPTPPTRAPVPPVVHQDALWSRWQGMNPNGIILQHAPHCALINENLVSMCGGSSSILGVKNVFGPQGKRSGLVFKDVANCGDTCSELGRLFDVMATKLYAYRSEYMDTLPEIERRDVSKCPRKLFSYQPRGCAYEGQVGLTDLCIPYDHALVGRGTGFIPNNDGYLTINLGTYKAPWGVARSAKDYAHRLLAAAILGPDFSQQPHIPNGAGKLEVSHLCGNAWCLSPHHLRVVETKHNRILFGHLRPFSD